MKQADALIVGAGPAGVSCAVWLAHLGFKPMLFEAGAQVGGLCLTHSYPDIWNATAPGLVGHEVAQRLAQSVADAGITLYLSSAVTGVVRAHDQFVLQTAQGDTACSPYLVLATGVRAKRLVDVNGQDYLESDPMRGLLIGPGEHVANQDFSGKRVAVLGGGDNAFENALYALSHGAREVRIFARTVRAQQQFTQQFSAEHIVAGEPVVDVGQQMVNGQSYDLILVFYGWEPCIPPCAGFDLARNAQGFVRVDDRTTETSEVGVYAIGEVSQRQHPCVVTAMADGVVAAKAIQGRIERRQERQAFR